MKEHDLVRLKTDLIYDGIKVQPAGAVGVVIYIYQNPYVPLNGDGILVEIGGEEYPMPIDNVIPYLDSLPAQ